MNSEQIEKAEGLGYSPVVIERGIWEKDEKLYLWNEQQEFFQRISLRESKTLTEEGDTPDLKVQSDPEKVDDTPKNVEAVPAEKPTDSAENPVVEAGQVAAEVDETTLLSKIRGIVGNDVLEIFGDTGTGKSLLVHKIALETIKNGGKVAFFDSERNLSDNDLKQLGDNYRYSPSIESIFKFAQNPPKVDLVIIDSLGLPVLTNFARMNLKKRGEALLQMIGILGSLKEHCFRNGSIAIVTNQPISELGVEEGEPRRPFGHKSSFATKEVWYSEIAKGKDESLMTVTSFRSRNMGFGTEILRGKINSEGMAIDWLLTKSDKEAK